MPVSVMLAIVKLTHKSSEQVVNLIPYRCKTMSISNSCLLNRSLLPSSPMLDVVRASPSAERFRFPVDCAAVGASNAVGGLSCPFDKDMLEINLG